jgi:signal transduction histidine kinase
MAARHIQIAGYIGAVVACFALGILAGWNKLAVRIDHQAYDVQSRLAPDAESEAVVVAIDEPTLRANGERGQIRNIVSATLEKLRAAHPKAVALDVTLGGYSDETQDARLEAALLATPNLILPCLVDSDGKWEDPAPRFHTAAAAIGHVHYETDISDGVTRQLALETEYGGEHRWAISLEAFHVAHSADIVESPGDLEVGRTRIPDARHDPTHPMFIRYAQSIPIVSAAKLDEHLSELHGKTVFLGVTALSMANDRLKIPTGETIPGVTVHAHVYETLRRGAFLTDATSTSIFAVCIVLATGVALVFAFLSGWKAYLSVLPFLALPLFLPTLFLGQDIVFPLTAPTAVAWLCFAGAATYQHFVVRGTLRRAESEKARYQEAIHWAAHEMRTPLTAIQGSSELMSRYKLPEEKRGELSAMINSESKRLSRIIQTFLDVERLAEGQMELKKELFAASVVVDTCMARVAPIAERKNIALTLDAPVEGTLTGDRELMEYAFYNLLTNAVKYSPPETHIRVVSTRKGTELRLAVHDQGIGMDAKELKNIFKKFYRTKRAEQSGEAGTGIGLSIVQQIVTHHGGRIDVSSTPGKGSSFTMVLSAQ